MNKNITNLEKVFQVVRAGWVGQAEENFEAEVYQAAIKVIELIGQMRDTLLNNIDLLGALVIQQDSEIKGREFSFK